MLIGIISDTHDNAEASRDAVQKFNDAGVEQVIHAGDIVAPFTAKIFADLKCPFAAVFGNNDGEKVGVQSAVQGFGGTISTGHTPMEFDGIKFMVMHEPWGMKEVAASGEYDVVVYGHTHKKEERKQGETLVLNPGEAGGHLTGECSCVLFDTGQKRVKWIELEG